LSRVRVAVFMLSLACVLGLPAGAGATPTFLSPINISDAGQDAFEPQVAVDASTGNATSVWTRSDGSNFRIQTATRTPAGPWSVPQNISDPGQSASGPAIAIDPSGNALAVWTRSDGLNGRIQAAYRQAGGSFGTPVTVSDAGGDASGPDVTMDSTGKATVVWSRFDGTKLRVQAAVRGAGTAGTFIPAQTLSAAGQDAFEPRVATGSNADDSGVVVWTRSDGTNLRIQSSRRRDRVGFPRPKGATPLRVALALAYTQCPAGTGTRQHGPPFAVLSCTPPTQSSSVLTIGTTDANGFGANFQGSVKFLTQPGNANTDANEADVKLLVNLTDIRNKPSGTDYTGRVLVNSKLQITDTLNAEETPEPGTTEQTDFKFPVNCAATADANVGGLCSVNTTANSIYPGSVLETRRTIWQLSDITVKDAGPNGTGYANCPPTCGDGDEGTFLRQGIFAP
jgi:hypothetical protein